MEFQRPAIRAAKMVASTAFALHCAWTPQFVQAEEFSGPEKDRPRTGKSDSVSFKAPAGELPAVREISIDGYRGAVLPNGRLITPVGAEVNVDAPKPFGLALSPDGKTLATINSGASRFSVSLIRNPDGLSPQAQRVNVDATFMGVAFSPDGAKFYASGGENGNVWVGETAAGAVVGSVNLNGLNHPLNNNTPWNPATQPANRFKGAYPGNMAITKDGRYLYVVDQGGFHVHIIDTTKIVTGVAAGAITDPNNFPAVVGRVRVGRYPYGIALSPDDKMLFVTHVGVFQYAHLRPDNPTGDANKDYPLCYPGVGYPQETTDDTIIKIKKVDPRNLPVSLQDPEGIRCGYVDQAEQEYTVPGLGSPNAPESSSVYALELLDPTSPLLKTVIKTGPLVGEKEDGIAAFSGSHPNAVVIGPDAVYVSNGNNDSISVLSRKTLKEIQRVRLAVFKNAVDRRLKGTQPVGLALSPDNRALYVAEAGINAVGVLKINKGGKAVVQGHIPVGWWPSSIQVSPDGKKLYVANAHGRGAGPNTQGENISSPKHSTLGTVTILTVPSGDQLDTWTDRVMTNNGFVEMPVAADPDNPIPSEPNTPSTKIKHVIFINKENATHDLLLGDITVTRKGVPVNGEPTYAMPPDAAPNHRELALRYTFSDNFYLEPSVSSDGHRWLTNTYTAEFEQTHWPASYGGRRRDAGDDPEVIASYPGRLGFTNANSSPEPNDYNQHGGIYLHLARHGKTFINFGNGYEFALIDEPYGVEPTGSRQHANVPMEKILRDNSDHLYPTYNTHIPDAPLPEDPTRFSRFGRFKQVFEDRYVDRVNGVCKLPDYVDLYYPNDHGGGANDIYPDGSQPWSFKRFVQDNDVALGLTVELISNSPCWKDTVIFVVEDDTQNGLDHVDGHRSIFLAISPWVKKEYLSKTHTSLASIFKTVNLILGLPPLNLYDAAATDLRDLFTGAPDFTPYNVQPVQFARGASEAWIQATAAIDFSTMDADEVNLRKAILESEGLPRKKQ